MKGTDKTGRMRENKVEPIYITDDMLTDHAMDEFLRKSMIEEADRLERELNSDPKLMGISASDNLFFRIKIRLQKIGVWEEDKEDGRKETRRNTLREFRPFRGRVRAIRSGTIALTLPSRKKKA